MLILFTTLSASGQVDTSGFDFIIETDSSGSEVQTNLITTVDSESLDGINTISLELLFLESENSQILLVSHQIPVNELSTYYTSSGKLNLSPAAPGFTYVLVIKLVDSDGHQLTTLTKTIHS